MKKLWGKIYPYWQKLYSCKALLAQNKTLAIKIVIPFIIIILGFFSCSYSQWVIYRNIQSIFSISDAIRDHFIDKPGYWGLNTEYVLKEKIVPDTLVQDKSIILQNDKKILIGSGINADTVMPMAQNFDIIMPELNRAQCMAYAESVLTEAQKLAIISISIVNSKGSYVFEWGGTHRLPIDKYETKQICQDKDNTIIWSLK